MTAQGNRQGCSPVSAWTTQSAHQATKAKGSRLPECELKPHAARQADFMGAFDPLLVHVGSTERSQRHKKYRRNEK